MVTPTSVKITDRHNLPHQLTSFIGREQELSQLRQLVAHYHLITLTGPGGVGKTRLALQTAAQLIDTFADGVWLVELATLGDPLLIVPTVCQTLNLPEEPGRAPLATLIAFLQARQTLLVLDNCEHLIQEAASVADQLLKACPDLTILTTSREALNIPGEKAFRVPSLALPQLTAPLAEDNWETLKDYAAIQLFVAHAQLLQAGFDLNSKNAGAVLETCQRLDGIPLALELAAARLRGLGIVQLASRLNDRFRLLIGGRRTALPRQQTLQAMLDWSYNLLTAPEKVVLRRLSVFVGSFSIEAAETICAGSYSDVAEAKIEPEQVLDLLWQLVNKSLIVMEESPDQTASSNSTRYRLLETIREYSKIKLSEANEVTETAQKHYQWCAQLAQAAAQAVGGPNQTAEFNQLEQEHSNLRAVLDWLVSSRRLEEAALLALNLWKFWQSRSYTREAYRRLKEILALSQASATSLPDELQPRLLNALGTLSYSLRQFEEANHYQNQALNLWQEQGDKVGLANALLELSWQSFLAQKLELARQYARQSLAIARQIEQKAAIAAASYIYALATHHAGSHEGIITALEESLTIWRELEDKANLVNALGTLGEIEVMHGNYERGRTLIAETALLQTQHGSSQNFISLLAPLLLLAIYAPGHADKLKYAARVLGVMTSLEEKRADAPNPWQSEIDKYTQIVTAQLGPTAFQPEFELGLKMTAADILALAQLITAPPAVSTHFSRPAQLTRPAFLPNGLTAREVEVLKLVAAGHSNPQIAQILVLSRKTVEAHLRSIFAKIEVTSRAAAARFAVEHKLT